MRCESRSSIDTSNNHDNLKHMFTRSLHLPKPGTETFFLWGPRQTGKTTLLAAAYPDALWIDLLKAEEFRVIFKTRNCSGLNSQLVSRYVRLSSTKCRRSRNCSMKLTGRTKIEVFTSPSADRAPAR